MTIKGYPLNWPVHKARTLPLFRKRSDFKVTQRGRAVDELFAEIRMMRGTDIVLTTNVRLRVDGTPYADDRPMNNDPGAAVYFNRKGKPMCFACDCWVSLTENIWAIRRSIEAIRAIARWGSSEMMEQAFTGFTALPAPEQWWQVLGVQSTASRIEIDRAFRALAAEHHPDRGGNQGEMARINAARDAALQALQERE